MKRYLLLILICVNVPLFAQHDYQHLTATIIGSGSPKFNTERSGPSVLISYQDTHILVDMGNGTQANLNANNTKIKDLDGLLFTHHHLDHNEEFTPIFIQSLLGGSDIVISGPDPTTIMVDNILTTYKEDINYRLSKSGRDLKTAIKQVTTTNLKGGESFYIGDLKITCTPVHHTITTLAYRFDVNDESIVVSGDLTYSEALPILAKNVDYLIIDSGGTIQMGAKARPNKKPNTKKTTARAHVNLSESSQMAQDAHAKNIVLTHFNVTDIDEEATITEIRKNYTGAILFASDLMKIPYTEPSITSNNKTETAQKTKANTPLSFSDLLENMDTNKDEKISESEAKGHLKTNFKTRDRNNDGFITEDELKPKNR